MMPSFEKPSFASPSSDLAGAVASLRVRRAAAIASLLAVSIWLGGLVALGAIAAPIVFSGVVPFPASADAMTLIFRRFDLVAMSCASIVLATEAVLAGGAWRGARAGQAAVFDRGRGVLAVLAAGLAVLEGIVVSPRIAQLHSSGALRGVGAAGAELSRVHDIAKACGQGQLVLLSAVIVLHVLTLSLSPRASAP
jgi:hypothetical protein